MTDRLTAEIRSVFESGFVPSPGLADRVVGRLREDTGRRHRLPWMAAAVVLAGLVIIPLAGLALSARLGLFAGLGTQREDRKDAAEIQGPAVSLGAVSPAGPWLIVRDIHQEAGPPRPTHNVLYSSADNGRTWSERLRFDGVYDGMSFSRDGLTGVIWAIDVTPAGCTAQSGHSYTCPNPASYGLTVYATPDRGLHWAQREQTPWGVAHVSFEGEEGWVISTSVKDGFRGSAVYQTADAGSSWERMGALPAGVRSNSYAFGVDASPLRFTDSAHGWFASRQVAQPGHSGLWVTSDGGRTWHEASVPSPAGHEGDDMVVERPSFFNNHQALLPVSLRRHGGADNATPNLLYAYSSADGGATWVTPRPLLGAEAARFQPVGEQWSGFFLDASHWWVTSTGLTAGDGVQAAPAVARSTDGGTSWQIYRPSPRILVMRFSDGEHGWAADVSGPQNTNGLLRTSDGGAHWVRVKLPARGG